MSRFTPEEVEAAKVECLIDGHKALHLEAHLRDVHGMTVEQYQRMYPNAPVVSQLVLTIESELAPNINRRKAKSADELVVSLAGLKLPVNHLVPAEACLPLPPNYRLPRFGKLAQSIAMLIEYIACNRSTWVSGPPGTGKDAVIHAISALLRKPALMLTIDPSLDIDSWMFEKDFGPGEDGQAETFYTYGKLFKALTEGYTDANGDVHPYIILLSDFDRATKAQVEKLRLILDSIQGRVMGPNGDAVPVVSGTTIVATANSQGGGDETGRCISARPVDSSIMNRFERKVIFSPMSWKDEGEIVKSKFPALFEHDATTLDAIGYSTKALRKAIEDGELYAEFSHRDVCNWCSAAVDRLQLRPNKTSNLLSVAAQGWIQGLPDRESRLEAARIIDPFIKGGHMGGQHIEDEDELVPGF